MMNAFKTAALLAALSAILLIIGQMLGGQSGLLIAFGIASAMNCGSYWSVPRGGTRSRSLRHHG
jgi:heat shock protein HtpX